MLYITQIIYPTTTLVKSFLFINICLTKIDKLSFGSYNKHTFRKGVFMTSNTKQEILNAALELFSKQGYEATSISQLADAVGIRKASLYSHFENKQAILDTLLNELLIEYDKHSIFTNADWNDPTFTKKIENITPQSATQMFIGHINYILHDPKISKVRKLLTIEQFQNSQMAKLQTKQSYTNVMNFFTGMMNFLIENNKLEKHNPEIMAAQLCLPISVWINLCDRQPQREEEIMLLLKRHINHFFELYQLK